ncbi:eukaryotic translation initiation factor 3 subunit D [Cryptococcus wingfieldii CBS 7118]|uniref:Eukaryotic translation initiation factor 3 subunit D n=1 Tax=Cryptococcus wingfieldii CBS 7118 TaxID=1295528 RepID=A0A1E3JRI1_9TREE|nr:eukaryotic translation initiation factor 3 subunit D [Cryptococcus wingfieldii CBS 7118]ODO03489.1 eukaryotic translation initiation factor 3 subunit D [Cryptococcus wingfieldii CBS 7118]
MPDFFLPQIHDNPDSSWGPSSSALPSQFKDCSIPYAPFSKSDKITRIADWHDSQTEAAGPRAGRTGQSGRRTAYGAAEGTVFGFVHDEDDKSFSLVDSGVRAGARGKAPIRGRSTRGVASARGARGRGGQRGGFGTRGGRGGGRGGYSDWNKPQRTRDSSVTIGTEWDVLEEVDFTRLAKLNLSVDAPEDLGSYGTLHAYDKTFDRINTRNDKPLEIVNRVRYNSTTSDDPIIAEASLHILAAQVFATDSILAVLMSAGRSVNSWDIIIEHRNGQVFFDKRESGPLDYLTVNENAADPPIDSDDPNNINSAGSLSLEATYISHNFASQVSASSKTKPYSPNPNPFYSSDVETEPPASTLYKYRKFDLSVEEEEQFDVVVRAEADAYLGKKDVLVTVKALNEYDPRVQGGSGKPLDWRKNLDTQKGAIVASEMKNNSAKFARWAIQSILVGAEQMKMGYISRANAKDAQRHVVVGVQSFKPADFARQMNVSLTNGWGIVRTIADLVLKQPEGKFVLVKDPNNPLVRLYRVPDDAFEAEADEEDEEDEE